MTETASHLLELADLTRQFVRRGMPFDAVSHVDLTIDAGEFVAIVGRSGNGKSTLINMVAGLVRPSSGTVRVDGREVTVLSDKELSPTAQPNHRFRDPKPDPARQSHGARQCDPARDDVPGCSAVHGG